MHAIVCDDRRRYRYPGAETIPNLDTLVLTNNRISNLQVGWHLHLCAWHDACAMHACSQDLDPLSGFKKLKMISLIGNPVTLKAHYRQVGLYSTRHDCD